MIRAVFIPSKKLRLALKENPATVDTATSTQGEAFPEGNDGVAVAGESLEQRWGRAILEAERQQREARDGSNQDLDPASEPTPLQKAYGGKVRTVSTDPSNQESGGE